MSERPGAKDLLNLHSFLKSPSNKKQSSVSTQQASLSQLLQTQPVQYLPLMKTADSATSAKKLSDALDGMEVEQVEWDF